MSYDILFKATLLHAVTMAYIADVIKCAHDYHCEAKGASLRQLRSPQNDHLHPLSLFLSTKL